MAIGGPPRLLSIAGSDPSGGAGVQADLKTFAALGCFGMAAITALTAQNTQGVRAVHTPPPEHVRDQIEAVLDDIAVDGVKIGMTATPDIINAIRVALAGRGLRHIVLDPVMSASQGGAGFGGPALAPVLVRDLFPLVSLVTANLAESAALAELPEPVDCVSMREAALRMHQCGSAAVLVKGGHLASDVVVDVLFDGVSFYEFAAPRVATRNTHGTGCALSAAIAALLARGEPLPRAAQLAKEYVSGALVSAADWSIGNGVGPMDHFHGWPKASALKKADI